MARLAWVTGGGSGIGRATARAMAARGWTVAVSARSQGDLDALAAEPASQGRIHGYALDVGDRAAVLAVASRIESELGAIETGLFAAGIYIPFGLDDFSAEKIETIYRTNVFGVANCIEAVLPLFRKRDAGHLAVVSSLTQYRGFVRTPGYGSSKAALLSICETLRLQTRGTGISVQIIVPHYVESRMTSKSPFAMPGIITAEHAAQMLLDGLDTDEFEILLPPEIVKEVQEARGMPAREYFEMAARNPLFGGTAE